MAPIAVEPTGLTPEQAPWATALRDAGVSHGGARPLACACAKKLAQVSREERAEQSRTCPIQAPPAVGCGAGRMARNPARCRGTRKRKRPTAEGWARNGGGAGRSRTAVRKPSSRSSTCVAVCFGSRPRRRAAARCAWGQQPWISLHGKLPAVKPADESALAAGRPCGPHGPAYRPTGARLAAIRRRGRNVRRSQLLVCCCFTRSQHLDMPCCESAPTSKPVQPRACLVYGKSKKFKSSSG